MKLFSTVLIAFAILSVTGCNELRKSEEKIKGEILNHVPWGSDISEVIDFLKTSNCEIRFIDKDDGFLDQRVRPAKVTGEMSVGANFGDYREFFFLTNVQVYFAFDKDGKLFDIWVWKTTDAP
jgi:hypothetical protein